MKPDSFRKRRPRMSVEAVAAWLGVSTRTLRSWRVSGVGPAWGREGRFVYYDKEAVMALGVVRRTTGVQCPYCGHVGQPPEKGGRS